MFIDFIYTNVHILYAHTVKFISVIKKQFLQTDKTLFFAFYVNHVVVIALATFCGGFSFTPVLPCWLHLKGLIKLLIPGGYNVKSTR